MDNSAPMDFHCEMCGKVTYDHMFEVARTTERMHYDTAHGIPEAEVADAGTVAGFCSEACLQRSVQEVLRRRRIELLPEGPGVGPIETCGICRGVVDRSHWHFSYTTAEMRFSGNCGTASGVVEHAVTCATCEGPLTRASTEGATQLVSGPVDVATTSPSLLAQASPSMALSTVAGIAGSSVDSGTLTS